MILTKGQERALSLIYAAEEEIAIKGIGNATAKQISFRAGTANRSAVNYFFGGMDELIRRLISFRVIPLRQCSENLYEAFGAVCGAWRQGVPAEYGSEQESWEALFRTSFAGMLSFLWCAACCGREAYFIRALLQLNGNGLINSVDPSVLRGIGSLESFSHDRAAAASFIESNLQHRLPGCISISDYLGLKFIEADLALGIDIKADNIKGTSIDICQVSCLYARMVAGGLGAGVSREVEEQLIGKGVELILNSPRVDFVQTALDNGLLDIYQA